MTDSHDQAENGYETFGRLIPEFKSVLLWIIPRNIAIVTLLVLT